jgi:hypothetical protein
LETASCSCYIREQEVALYVVFNRKNSSEFYSGVSLPPTCQNRLRWWAHFDSAQCKGFDSAQCSDDPRALGTGDTESRVSARD